MLHKLECWLTEIQAASRLDMAVATADIDFGICTEIGIPWLK
jgi:hypothetical protein